MSLKFIDVWDVHTFDPDLIDLLETHADLVRDYLARDHEIFLSHDLGRGREDSILRPENAHAFRYHALEEAVGEEMEKRSIRAFHYTRLLDEEVDILRREGIHLSTIESLAQRLARIVARGYLTQKDADQVLSGSPLTDGEQSKARSEQFWLTSHPVPIGDSGVTPLMNCWGGEVASMWLKDPEMQGKLAVIGKPRVVELVVPLGHTNRCHAAGEAVVATFARSRGSIPCKKAFDLCLKKPLQGEVILAVHTEGDEAFESLGKDYPPGFVDVNIGRWKELTGEDD